MSIHHAQHPLGRVGLGLVTAVATVTLAACGSSGSGYGSSSTTPAASGAGSGAGSGSSTPALHTTSISLGTILVDGSGRTIYYFAGDKGTTSSCTGACATNWPPVPAPASTASAPGISAPLGSTTRSDGAKQLTVDGHPVYTFVGDKAPGDANGQGKMLNGGLWTVVSPDGKAVSGSGTTTGAYGY
ncbi:COG4315 family predicted lipoprotein [Cumulibacter manganitolerans]|uniref:COG4315 family predicted lipoprotein n=1 Tax=Cumulibacter manganitolerans TaxID=1884992 RepID=UPI0012972907|nr:hypothetical protein [Cumulibacter manganitolerans]